MWAMLLFVSPFNLAELDICIFVERFSTSYLVFQGMAESEKKMKTVMMMAQTMK